MHICNKGNKNAHKPKLHVDGDNVLVHFYVEVFSFFSRSVLLRKVVYMSIIDHQSEGHPQPVGRDRPPGGM